MADARELQRGNQKSGQTNWRTQIRALVIHILAVAFWLAAATSGGCTSKSTALAPLAVSVSKLLKGGNTSTLAITCNPGDAVLARVSQFNIDVTLELAGQSGAADRKVDFPSGRFGDEFLTFRCGPTGHHHIRIASVARTAAAGTVRIATYNLDSASASVNRAFQHMANAAGENMVRGPNAWSVVLNELNGARETWESQSMWRELALTEFAIGYVHYMDLTEWQIAAAHAGKAAQIFARIGDPIGEAASQQLQGAAIEEVAAALPGSKDSERQRLFAASESLLRNAEVQQQQLGQSFDAAMSLDYLALNYYYAGREDLATSALARTLQEFSALGERSAQCMVLQNIATINYENGGYAQAKQAFETLLSLMSMQDDPYLYATVLHNSALVLSVTGDLENALTRELKALDIHKSRESKAGQARSLYAIGIIYQRLGQYERALEFLTSSQVLDKQAIDTSPADETHVSNQLLQIFSTLIGIGNVERAMGNLRSAAKVHVEARRYASSEKSQARVELALGLDYAAMGNTKLALTNFDRAQKHGPTDSNPYIVEIAVARSRMLRATGEAARGLRPLQDAERTALANGNLREQSMVSMELAASKAALGERLAALGQIKRSISIAERLRMNTTSPELRAVTTAGQRDAYREWVNVLLSKNFRPSNQELTGRVIAQSLLIADRSHDRSLLERLDHRNKVGPEKINDGSDQLYDELAGKQATLDALLERDTVDLPHVSRMREEIALLQAKIDLANKSGGQANPDDVRKKLSLSALNELRLRLPEQCTLIEYLISGDASWAWVVKRGTIALYRLPGEPTIKALVENMRQSLQSPIVGSDGSDTIQALFDAILRPALAGNPTGCLVIVPDGDLHYVPFSVLTQALSREPTLAPSISVAPSLELLHDAYVTRRVQKSKSRVVVFGSQNPALGRETARPALRSLSSEIGAIQAAFGTDNTYVANNSETTRSGFTHFDFTGFGIVHIATHTNVDVSNGGLSRFIFESGDDVATQLRSYDISTMRFDSPLVVLSACDSGLGQPIDGEGLVGFVYAFIGAGAESVLMSLWRVPDEATARLMGAFYRELRHGRTSPELALASAQLQMRSSTHWKHPYYWSGFEIVSTRMPIDTKHFKEEIQ